MIFEMRDLIEQLTGRQDLELAQITQAATALLDPEVDDALKADFLRELRTKGETAAEIAGFAATLLARAVDPGIDPVAFAGPMLDVCGTGGDRMESFNISSTAMFLLAAGGAVIVKHGNRAITSKSGGADVLDALGVEIEYPPALLRECLAATGIGFMFAPSYHPGFRVIGPVRKALAAEGITTIFNILGPLLNPASPPYQLVGVFSESLLSKYAEVLGLLGRRRAWAVHSSGGAHGGVDELSTLGPNHYCAVEEGVVTAHTLDAGLLGFPRSHVEELRGGNATENALILTGILGGHIHGPKRDVVILNAAAGFVVAGLARDLSDAIAWSHEQIQSGRARAKLKALQDFSTAHPVR
jgi:anthranilate phosphoribosyltransferase